MGIGIIADLLNGGGECCGECLGIGIGDSNAVVARALLGTGGIGAGCRPSDSGTVYIPLVGGNGGIPIRITGDGPSGKGDTFLEDPRIGGGDAGEVALSVVDR